MEEKASDGDWDLELSLIEDDEFYSAARDVFFGKSAWNETSFFNGRLQTAGICCEGDRANYKMLGCKYLNYLFNAMRSYGYVQDPNSDLVGITHHVLRMPSRLGRETIEKFFTSRGSK